MSFYKIPGGQYLSDIFYPLSLGGVTGATGTGYNYNTGSGNQDLKNLFALYTPGTTGSTQTYYSSNYYGGQDLNKIFQNINYPPLYQISNQSNIIINFTYENNNYNGIIFQNELGQSGNPPTIGSVDINFLQDISANILVVGGGGGGGGGVYTDSGGGGGGGGGIYYIPNLNITTSDQINITVGYGGLGGLTPTIYPSKSGTNGANSSITINTTIYTSEGGGAGVGYGAVKRCGGDGGNGGYGGGGGGGAGFNSIVLPGYTAISVGGLGGSGLYVPGSAGNLPLPGQTISYGQDGGSSGLKSITIPFYGAGTTITLGGGGGGGGYVVEGRNQSNPWAGNAGQGSGGAGNYTQANEGTGFSANNNMFNITQPGGFTILAGFGGGGGGGGGGDFSEISYSVGGDGGNGVVMIWWPV
jgi:hypothetical protein